MTDQNTNEKPERNDRNYEIICGIILAFLAAVLSINDLASGKFEGDQVIAANEKASAYSWYSSKSIKQTLVEGQRDLLDILLVTDSIVPEQAAPLKEKLLDLDQTATRYDHEKQVILDGSVAHTEELPSWGLDDEFNDMTGANEWKVIEEQLDLAGNVFDLAGLFLQISLVFGAISLVLSSIGVRRTFFYCMNLTGLTGLVTAILAITRALAV